MLYYINRHIQPNDTIASYDIVLERFENENDAKELLFAKYFPIIENPQWIESVDVRIDWEDNLELLDCQKDAHFQIIEHEYESERKTTKESCQTIEEAMELVHRYLKALNHSEDDDRSYYIVWKNR